MTPRVDVVPRVAIVNLGCRVNRVEADLVAERLRGAGCAIVDQADAQAIVVNTCAVTAEAEAKTRKVVRRCAALPQAPVVVATGCVASLFADEVASLGNNVVAEPMKALVPGLVLSLLGVTGERDGDVAPLAAGGESRPTPTSGARPTPTGRTRPGIKIQDGCDNRCTYCIVWKARGESKSVSPDEIIREVRHSLGQGAREVVLTGINLGCYDWRWDGGSSARTDASLRLPGLLSRILDETDVGRVRLGSIEPPDVTPELVGLMAASRGRIAPFLHVCLQSGCDATLSRMGRVYDTGAYRDVVTMARDLLPGLSLGTDLIVGFPGETDDEFERSLAFCAETGFSRMHVFRYSVRPGTPAATMPGQVPAQVMAARAERMSALATRMRTEEARRLVGTDDLVVVQYPGRGVSGGLFDVELDPRVPLDALVGVRIDGCSSSGVLRATVR